LSIRSSQKALVTGVSRGIGRALVIALRDAGWQVAGCSRSPEAGCEIDFYESCDISDPVSVASFAGALSQRWDALDLLIHNAGVLGPRAPLRDIEPAEWKHVIDVNLNGSFYVVREFFDLLEAADEPRVVLMSSSVGRKGRGEWGAYSASKFGVEGLVDILADELEKGIVVSVNPGGTATDMRAEAYPDEDPATLPSAAEVAEIILGFVEEMPGSSARRLNVRDRIAPS